MDKRNQKFISKIFQNVNVFIQNTYSKKIRIHIVFRKSRRTAKNVLIQKRELDASPVKNLFAFIKKKLCLVSGVPCGRQLDKMGHITGREDFVNGAARLPQLHNVLFCPAE